MWIHASPTVTTECGLVSHMGTVPERNGRVLVEVYTGKKEKLGLCRFTSKLVLFDE